MSLKPDHDRFLLQLAGAPGVGKSTLAFGIGAQTGAVVVDRDVIKSALLDGEDNVEMAGGHSFDVMFAVAGSILEQGTSVILDTTSHYADVPRRAATLAETAGASFLFLECTLEDRHELERRLTTRRRRSSQMGIFDVTPRGSTAEKIGVHRWRTYGPPEPWPILDLAGPPDSLVRSALDLLGLKPAKPSSTDA